MTIHSRKRSRDDPLVNEFPALDLEPGGTMDEVKDGVCPGCGLDHEVVRSACQTSTWNTASILCGYNQVNYPHMWPSSVFHKRALDLIDRDIDQGVKRFCILWPRDHLKTSLLTTGLNIRFLINDPSFRSFIFHKNATKAAEMIGNLQHILLSDVFRHYYPEIVPEGWLKYNLPNGKTPRWNQSEIEIKRPRFHLQANFTALGLETTMEGGHVHAVFPDDLVDRQTTASPVLMQKAIEFTRNLDPLLESARKNWVFVIGTFWPGGYYEDILASEDYRHYVFGCYQDESSRTYLDMGDIGKPIWFEEHTNESLAAMERRMGVLRLRPPDAQQADLEEQREVHPRRDPTVQVPRRDFQPHLHDGSGLQARRGPGPVDHADCRPFRRRRRRLRHHGLGSGQEHREHLPARLLRRRH